MFNCSFCSASEADSEIIVAGPEVNICDECIALCVAVLRDSKNPKAFQKVIDTINEPKDDADILADKIEAKLKEFGVEDDFFIESVSYDYGNDETVIVEDQGEVK
jgi:hypothetical protein